MRKEKTFFITENINSGQKSSLQWVEDSYSCDSSDGSGSQKTFLHSSLSNKKVRLFMIGLLVALSVLVGKSFYLQIVKGDHYFALAENNRLKVDYIKAQRGLIYDRQGVLLADNIYGFSLFVVPAQLPTSENERAQLFQLLVEMFDIDINDLELKIKEASKYYFQPVVIKTGIDYDQAMALKIISNDLPGVGLEVDSWRHYASGNSLAHILGYVGKINTQEYEVKKSNYLLSDNIGKAGLEKYYEDCLRGDHGFSRIEVDAFGREKKIISQKDFTPGCDLHLTINIDLQNYIYEVLERQLGDKKAAAVIVSNPQNGEILALADYPSYDNNLFATAIGYDDYQKLLADERKPLFSRSILGEYPSGSTIKTIIAAAALQEGVVTANTTFNSVGGLWVLNQWSFPDWKSGGHGLTNIYKAIAESVNTYFYYIGGGYDKFEGLGVHRIAQYLRSFGLGSPMGIDLLGERPGLVPDPQWKSSVKKEQWYIGDTYHLSIGQGYLLVTPLQVNGYNNAIANNGIIYKPHLVKKTFGSDDDNNIIDAEIIVSDVIDKNNIAIVKRAMRQAVTGGSAVGLSYLPVEVAAKTGTAQWRSNRDNHAWLNAFAPYDHPTFSVTVLVEEGGEGSAIAVPIARDIIDYWFTRL